MAMDTDRPARAASAGRRPRWLRTAKNSLARPPRGTAGPPVGDPSARGRYGLQASPDAALAGGGHRHPVENNGETTGRRHQEGLPARPKRKRWRQAWR